MRKVKIILVCIVIVLFVFIGIYRLVTGIKNRADYRIKITDINRNEVLAFLNRGNVEVKENKKLIEVRMSKGIPDGNIYILRYESGNVSRDFIDGEIDSDLEEYIRENGEMTHDYTLIIITIIFFISLYYLIKII